jgi:hypothetical protein
MNRHPVIHGRRPLFRYSVLILTLAVIPLSCAAAPIYAVFGEDIPLGGTAPGSAFIYLFLSGPNLPDGGISLAGGTAVTTGVPSSFTRIEVLADGTWAYTWRTGSLGRILDQSTYTIFAVNEPLSRPDLDDAAYNTQAVVFGTPGETIAATSPEASGSLAVESSPGMSAVTLDGRAAGITPLVVSGIPAGFHTLVVAHEGYSAYRADFMISAGETQTVSAVLTPLTTTTSNPIPGLPTAPPQGRLAPLALVPFGAVAITALGLRRKLR